MSTNLADVANRKRRSFRRVRNEIRERLAFAIRKLQRREVRRARSIRLKCATLGTGDGAWSFCPDRLVDNAIVYSFGVGRDISFDVALAKQFACEVYLFDPTPLSREWIETQTLPPQIRFSSIGIGAEDGTQEFVLPFGHKVSFSGLTPSSDSKASCLAQVQKLSTIAQSKGHHRIHLLKMDIEGMEYDVLQDVVTSGVQVDQILVEFHHRMLNEPSPWKRTEASIDLLESNGFRLFHVSSRGLEYSFSKIRS